MATKKKPLRRAMAGKPASRAIKTSRTATSAKKSVAKPAAKSAAKPAAKRQTATPTAKKAMVGKTPGARASNISVVSIVPAARRGGAAVPGRIPRRAVFVDVENTSSEDDLFEVLEALRIDRAEQPTEVTAVGNWRAISQRLGRRLAGVGAQLVHSAPATGVKDWSDLWIAVAAGCWLGAAEPGDVLEIVSNDRAFDAVGDAAAARGVTYRRLLHKRGTSAAVSAAAADEDEEPKRRRRSRGGRRRRGRGSAAAPPPEHAPPPAAHHAPPPARTAQPKPAHRAPSHPPLHDAEAHGATRDQIVSVIGRLSGSDPTRWINLDVLEKALKAEGFARPPGSPRLVTRLRMFKDVEVDSHGRARLVSAPEPAPAAEDEETAAAAKAPAKKRRRRRKPTSGGDAGEAASADVASFAAAAYSEPPAE